VKDDTRLYLRDCYDHTVQIIDLVEVYRDIASGLTDLYMSGISNRMNEVMKVLTIISTIFIPLSFVAGVYGMNFDTKVSPWNMPELEWYFGYPFALGVMAAMTAALVYFFGRKGWLRSLMPSANGQQQQRRVDEK
jgi:magnesium transporter